jgi:hypothetical protein
MNTKTSQTPRICHPPLGAGSFSQEELDWDWDSLKKNPEPDNRHCLPNHQHTIIQTHIHHPSMSSSKMSLALVPSLKAFQIG